MISAEALEKEAIKAAICSDWPKAIKANRSFLRLQPKDIVALNRLAWAYAELGKTKLAKSTYKKVLAVDKYNLIANKNLKKLTTPGKKQPPEPSVRKISSLFLEETGKTKVVSLARLAPPKILATLHCAEEVQLSPKKRFISVKDDKNHYLGVLPDDLSFRLNRLIKGGNQYRAWIKGAEKQSLQIFIRETYRSPRFKNFPSFPPQMGPTGEEE